MSKVFEGDEWKYVKQPETALSFTREETQRRIDNAYATGQCSLEDWRRVTNSLSEPPMRAR